MPGPDFPTAGIINGAAGIVEAYKTGRGRILVRAKAEIETDDNGRETIIVTEMPYQVNKARLIEKIAELRQGKEARRHLADGCATSPTRTACASSSKCARDTSADVLLNNLFQQTQMQVTFGINMVALVDGQPRTLNLREILEAFVRHRREVVTRRTIFDLRKARARAHIARRPDGRAREHRRDDRADQDLADRPRSRSERMLARRWEPGLVRALLAAAGAEASRPEDMPAERRPSRRDGYQLSEVQAQADPRDAPEPPDRAGAGKAQRRIQGTADDDRGPDRDPRRSRQAARR